MRAKPNTRVIDSGTTGALVVQHQECPAWTVKEVEQGGRTGRSPLLPRLTQLSEHPDSGQLDEHAAGAVGAVGLAMDRLATRTLVILNLVARRCGRGRSP
nr:hypothetical protein GCM10020241_65910 [Streptoalloteichus tenebrarius]